MKTHTSITCWIITEGIRGTENQCLGITQALNLKPVIKRITLRQPWKIISPWLHLPWVNPTSAQGDQLTAPWPDVIIAAGRKAVAPALWVKNQSKGKTILVQLQNPYISSKHFDLVITPQHDGYSGDNVITTLAGLHKVTPEIIETGRTEFVDTFSGLPTPRIAVLIGGNSKHHRLTAEDTTVLCRQLNKLASDGYGLMITASRRTGATNEKIMRDTLSHPAISFWDGTGDNPYFGMLGWADTILVTEDSVSMTSEAISTGKPTYIVKMQGGSTRLDAFHKGLQDAGMTRIFNGKIENWEYTPPHDTQKVAKKIREYLGKHGLKG